MTVRRILNALLFAVVVGGLSANLQAGDWASFRGPDPSGVSQEKNLPEKWDKTTNIKWTRKLPGPGNGSPVVSNGHVFVTCAEDKGKKRNLYCVDRKTGKDVWVKTVTWDKREQMHQTNPYCGSTPAADGVRVVVWHGSAGLFCYDFAGKELWKRDLGEFTHIWGYGSSPIIHNGKVYLNAGPGKRSFLIAVDLKTGKDVWKKDEPNGADSREPRMVGSWSTPVITKVDGKDQLICSMPTRVVAYDPETGTLLWELGGLRGPSGDLVYTSPVISGRIGVAMAGYGGPIVTFTLGGTGDVTAKNTLWKSEGKQAQRIGSGVIVNGYVYIANADTGTANCFELKTGKQKWRQRLGAGAHWGSLILADGRFYVTGQNGTTHVFHPNPEKFKRIAENKMGEPSNATPAFSNGEIFLRTFSGLYCVREKK